MKHSWILTILVTALLAGCDYSSDVYAESDTVTLDAFSSNSISGSIQASFTDGGSVAGEFEVDFCDELDK
jgi:hypothetical protein